MIIRQQVSDSGGDFIPNTAYVCFFTQQSKAGHSYQHSIDVNAPQIHEEDDLRRRRRRSDQGGEERRRRKIGWCDGQGETDGWMEGRKDG